MVTIRHRFCHLNYDVEFHINFCTLFILLPLHLKNDLQYHAECQRGAQQIGHRHRLGPVRKPSM